MVEQSGVRVRGKAFGDRLRQLSELDNAPSYPPTRLDINGSSFVSESRLSDFVEKVLELDECIPLEHSVSLALIGSNSILEFQAVHINAAIEQIRNAVMREQKDQKIPNQKEWFEKKRWKYIRKEIVDVLKRFSEELGNENEKFLKQAEQSVNLINKKSLGNQSLDFWSSIGLEIGVVENNALRVRNFSAHGYRYEEGKQHELSMANKALFSLFCRVVLKLIEFDEYFDYSSYGHPLRDIDSPLGGPNGDGQSISPLSGRVRCGHDEFG